MRSSTAPSTGSWWLFYRGPGDWIPVGYYPKSLFGAGKLAPQAEKIACGGEDTGQPSAKQMGSGATAEIDNIVGAWGTYLYFGGPSCN